MDQHEAEKIARQVGETLREIRKKRGMSLLQLAEATDVSKLTLGNIERGEANPSLTVIWKIANGLSIPLSLLLHENADITISRKHKGNKVLSANEACTLEPMFDSVHHGSSEIHRAFLKPHSEYKPGAHQLGVTEYVTVMSGEVLIQIENDSYHLYEYDSIKFSGDREHAYINPTSSTTVLHFVMTYSK
ncbi:helix-turn-helix domain-containing protein [Halalkalibacter kiskunsagensis]|uniref:Helix-turn-helix domain-containing protein n=1 Tax=Halalkalibacter kiskunsagensis TaxID=1548599 RepID=A0ABV6KC42_9BACI